MASESRGTDDKEKLAGGMGHTGYGRWVGQDSLQEQRMLGDMCGRWGGKESSHCVEMIGLRDTSQCLRDMIASDARTL